jgi:hypothetical protein
MRASLRREFHRHSLPISLAFNPRGDASIIAVRTKPVNFVCCAFGIARTERSRRRQRAERQQAGAERNANLWSGRLDSNQRPHPPQGCALPGCATSRPVSGARRVRAWGLNAAYHSPSRSVKNACRASRKSSRVLRLMAARESGSGAWPFSPFAPFVFPPAPFCSRRWRRAPAMVKPSS